MGFRKDFMWGASTADYQIEGAFNEDGKGLGIWDVLSREKGRIARGETGDKACDHYHRYEEDVSIMKELGLSHYRFSISWPRVLPEGIGKVNEKGLLFYSRLVDKLLDANIQPVVTLYHWNMPYALYRQGGWKNEQSSDWFAYYTRTVVEALGDRVRFYLTFNEPQIFTFLGYDIGLHAPFEQNNDHELLLISKNVLLAHGKALRIIREASKGRAMISFSSTGDCFIPHENTEESILKARNDSLKLRDHFLMSHTWFTDPILFGRFPDGAAERFGDSLFSFSEEEWALVSQPIDFFAYNVYQSSTVFRDGREINEACEYPGCPKTSAGLCVTPEVLYWSAKFWSDRYKKPLLITENGCALNDWICLDGAVHDTQRIDFLSRYLGQLKKAADEGIDIWGYTCWSLLDSFEWASGYDPRHGLVHVDFRTQKRTIKDSGFWYRSLIRQNGDHLLS